MLSILQAEQPVVVCEIDIAIEGERTEVRVVVEPVALQPGAERRLGEQSGRHGGGEHQCGPRAARVTGGREASRSADEYAGQDRCGPGVAVE